MWSKLEVLYHIVKAGSLVKAAKTLKTDQPTLSNKLATLERKFGFKLINRSKPHRPLTLTEKGKIVFEAAQKNFMTLQLMETALYEKEGMRGKIRISTTHAIADFIINPLLIQFGKKYPDVNLELLCNDSNIDIFANEVDFVVRPYVEDDPNLIQEPFLTFEAGLYASPDYLKKFGTPKTPEDLEQHRLIAFARPDENPYGQIEWMLKLGKKGKERKDPFYSANSVESCIKAAEEGMGIMLSYEPILETRSNKLVRVLKNEKSPKNLSYLIYQKKLEDIERMKKMKDFLLKNIKEKAKSR